MGDLFDRNVHPLYSVMAFVAAAIVAVLFLNILISGQKQKRKNQLLFFGFIICYCIQDGIWGLLASGVFNSESLLMFASAVFHFSSALAPVVWTMFFCQTLRSLFRHPRIWIYTSLGLFLVQLGMILVNFSNHFMFYVDGTGNYQTTDARAILFYLQFAVYIMMSVVSLVKVLQTKSDSVRKSFSPFLWVSAAPIFFDVFQLIYPDAPANSAGLCIACVLVQTYLMQTVETEVRELQVEKDLQKARQKELISGKIIGTLSLEYGPLYLADLNTGSLQVFRTSDMERALPVQQLAFEIPEYLPFIREYASRYVVESDRDSFLAWTDPKHMDEVINTRNITEFNYQRNMKGTVNYYQFCCARVSEDTMSNLMVFGFRNVDMMVKKDLETKQRLEKALKAAKVASESKTQFLFNMSHDIRTPMNAILGFTDIAIKHKTEAEKVDESLGKIKTAGNHLLNLINDILETSRIESGTMELSEHPVDLRKLIEGVSQMSGSLAIPKSIDFKTRIGEIRDPYVYTDELHANEVLINLISNAVKYTPAGGKVWFSADQISDNTEGKATYRFEVIDNGIGMSEEFQEHLFEAFSREKTSTVSKQEGAGLGLSIVKKIVDLAGGTITVKSKTGEGTTFTVELSFRVMEKEAIRKFEEENRQTGYGETGISFENRKVLLVDDNELNREIATEILEEAGLIVETAEDGDFAVERIREKGPDYYDFILMDIQMPVMDGYQATKEIRKLPGGDRVKIIALSANAFEEDIQKSLASGMNAHAAKPIDVNTLFETMQGLIRNNA